MTCQELDRLLYPYLDGEFQPEERLDFEAHLSHCAPCQRRVDEERGMRQMLRRAARHSVPRMQAPASLRSGIQLGLQREQRRAQVGQWLRVGAVALVMVTTGGGWVAFQSGLRQRASVEEAVQRHTRNRPLEFVAGTPEMIEGWFNDKVDHRVTLPHLPRMRPVGARFSTLNGQEVVYVSYETLPDRTTEPQRRVGVFVYPADGRKVKVEEPPTVEMVGLDSSAGYNVVTLRENEITYELVTDMNEADIRRLLRDQEQKSSGPTARPAAISSEATYQPVSLP
ncbi:transmembrane regulator PrtR [Corallococcus sp. H22C18031201]|nr:zf-HC2 domain-containing protein [Citreicoccus inhibens]RJS25073.1 transmembrane regulator PrtR [Corallococcus sp. H22C18031201]